MKLTGHVFRTDVKVGQWGRRKRASMPIVSSIIPLQLGQVNANIDAGLLTFPEGNYTVVVIQEDGSQESVIHSLWHKRVERSAKQVTPA